MKLELGDTVIMKKPHPCGSKEFENLLESSNWNSNNE